MEIIRAEEMGFCYGVAHALRILDQAKRRADEIHVPCYVLGQIIHNTSVVREIEESGIITLEGDDVPEKAGVVILRAHGVPDDLRKSFADAGFEIFDATCPIVLHEQKLVREAGRTRSVIVAGLEGHSEVRALMGVQTPMPKFYISDEKMLDDIDTTSPTSAVVQSTMTRSSWERIRNRIHEKNDEGSDIVILNDICNSTQKRHEALRKLCTLCDCVIIIGGFHSANTEALHRHAVECGKPSFHIECSDQIPDEVYGYERIGITAGASTPEKIIQQVIDTLLEH